MGIISYLLGPGLFFTPLIYVPLYLYIERSFSRHKLVQYILRVITVLGGFSLIIYALTAPLDFMVLMPSRGTSKNEVPASYFLVILGAALMTLPIYSKYIKFSNKKE
jgi:preprotein translocase subunit SecE